ncbi:MAG TPA: DinB family protein [Anaerolineales bacterium]|nr:DinB family protein [Anaerolineales bacterium]HNO30267.1 DinB family protein [Anaerolineales bacterium]
MSEINELVEKLKSEGERMATFFSELNDEQWTSEVYTEGTIWSVRNVLSHFVTAERGLVKLFEQVRTTGVGASDDFSIDRYNAAQQKKNESLTPADLLEQYRQVRAESVKWVGGLKDEELDIQGRHPFLGETVIREMVKMLYLHNQLHYRDVKRALK